MPKIISKRGRDLTKTEEERAKELETRLTAFLRHNWSMPRKDLVKLAISFAAGFGVASASGRVQGDTIALTIRFKPTGEFHPIFIMAPG